MTDVLLESVPNVSEGRRPEVIDRLAAAAGGVAGAHLLDRSSDPDHHRSVFTLVGSEPALIEALLALYEEALRSIDLSHHRGVHPRVGAVDVVPFVPLAGASMTAAVRAARRLAREVASRFDLGVFLYEEAASAELRRSLAALRRGGLSGLSDRLSDPAWAPDFGPSRLDPRAGVTAIGARDFLIAYNVVLESDDLELAHRIAREVRESSGGLPAVKAIGVALPSRKRVQVSMNLVDFRKTPPPVAFQAVAQRAADSGVGVTESELVGLAPEAAFEGSDPRRDLLLREFSPEKLLETHLRRLGLVPPIAS